MADKLELEIAQCIRCPSLVASRNNPVPGEGNPDAKLVVCGECPGREENSAGRPFVGLAGKLLNNMLVACGIKREDVFITNTVLCHPENNRNPTKGECDNCREFLDRRLEIVKPKYLLLLGSVATVNLLGERISQARLKQHDYKGIQVFCTYHPSFLLREPHRKADAWQDLQKLMKAYHENL